VIDYHSIKFATIDQCYKTFCHVNLLGFYDNYNSNITTEHHGVAIYYHGISFITLSTGVNEASKPFSWSSLMNEQNKLECLSLHDFQASLIFLARVHKVEDCLVLN
jgi:hypothetical protein